MYLIVAISLIGFTVVVLYLLSPLISPKPSSLSGAHVLVTGGSSGIGKAVAFDVAKRGANITLLARNQAKLSETKTAVEKYFRDKDRQRVICVSVDLCKEYHAVEKAFRQAESLQGPIDFLINCAGTSISGEFEKLAVEDFRKMMETNYFGSVYATKAVIPSMKEQNHGRIVFVSSQAGQLGLFGYTAYSGSKFALRGLAESLQMELKPYNIHISLAFPPDTDTPGFAEEQKSKPKETQLISETSGLFQPEAVAEAIINDAIQGKFLCYLGLDGYMLSIVTCGFSPVISITEALQQIFIMGLFRMISLFYLDSFDRIVKRCKTERETEVKLKSS